MTEDTRSRLLAAAKNQFAERGFYGASIAGVAGELGLTKQALLYHFKRKEDLYAAVLRDISQRLTRFIDANRERSDDPALQLENTVLELYVAAREYPEDTRILMRELLDNQRRAETAKDWYLKPFLDQLVAMLQSVPGMESLDTPVAFSRVYQLLGAAEYFAVSTPTLTRMFGSSGYADIDAAFPEELRASVRRLLRDRSGI